MARNFPNAGDIVSVTPGAIVNVPLSFSAWVYPVATASTRAVWGQPANNTGVLEIRLQQATGIVDLIKQGVALVLSSTATAANGAWSHIGITDSGTAQKIYINAGTPATSSQAISYATITTAYTIGQGFGSAESWGGRIADLALWSAVLTAGEITSLAGGIRPYNVRKTSLYGYWPLDGLQSPEPDLSGSKFNGTLTGTAFAPGPPTTLSTPRRQITSAVAAPGFIPAWSRQSNLPVIGGGTF